MKTVNIPCKIGDTVYKIASNGKIVSLIVSSIQLVDGGGYISCKQNRSVVTIPFEDFGFTTFTSKYKAQKFLSIKGGQSS